MREDNILRRLSVGRKIFKHYVGALFRPDPVVDPDGHDPDSNLEEKPDPDPGLTYFNFGHYCAQQISLNKVNGKVFLLYCIYTFYL